MWIALSGVMAPLPKGWKPVLDSQGELYYFNFETGESIWDHPCDEDYKKLVFEQRKILLEKGKNNYKPPPMENRVPSPTKIRSPGSTLKNSDKLPLNGTAKSTSTISEVINGKNSTRNNLRSDFAAFDTRDLGNVEFEEENEEKFKLENDDEEESEASWQKNPGSDDSSDGFHKPVDFGIDKETSIKLDKLNVMLMVEKGNQLPQQSQTYLQIGQPKETSVVRTSLDSAPTTSRDPLDSPTRNYVRPSLDDIDVKKSVSLIDSSKLQLESIAEEKQKSVKEETQKDFQKDLKLFKESLER